MEREISSGAMLGVVLLSLAAVIGLGFGVFAIAKGIANEGTVNVQDSLAAVSSQAFLDYDQKVVTGTQVIAGLKTFEGKPVAILIHNTAMTRGRAVHPDHDPYVVTLGTDEAMTTAGDEYYINYNAIIGGLNGTDPGRSGQEGLSVTESDGNILMYKKNGTYYIQNGIAALDGNVIYDNMTAGIFRTGNSEYVSTNSKYQATLIKDEFENYMGIVFSEISQ